MATNRNAMLFPGPRGTVRVSWKKYGNSFAQIYIEEQRFTTTTKWFGLMEIKLPFWKEVWESHSDYRLTEMERMYPKELVNEYVRHLKTWSEHDKAWSKFYSTVEFKDGLPSFTSIKEN